MSSVIQIRVPSTTVLTGGLVLGEVRLITTKQLEIASMQLQFCGTESTCWYEPVVRSWVWSSKAICQHDIPLLLKPSPFVIPVSDSSTVACPVVTSNCNDEGMPPPFNGESSVLLSDTNNNSTILEPGTYNYTFQWMVPVELPLSFKGSVGKIVYKLKACICKAGMVSGLFPITQELTMILIAGTSPFESTSGEIATPDSSEATIPSSPSPFIFTGSIKNVEKNFWFSKGGLKITSQLSKPVYSLGDLLKGSLQFYQMADNNCKTPMRITISLMQKSMYSAPCLKICYFKKNQTTVLQRQQMDTSALMQAKNNRNNDKAEQILYFQMTMPAQMTPSFQTQLILIQHFIRIHIDFGAFSLASVMDLPCQLVTTPSSKSEALPFVENGGFEPKIFAAYLCDAAFKQPQTIVSL